MGRIENEGGEDVFGASLEQALSEGASYLPGFLPKRTTSRLGNALNRINYSPFYNYHEKSGVTERFLKPSPGEISKTVHENILKLGSDLRRLVEKAGISELTGWKPNEYSVQLYGPSSFITPHFDGSGYYGIVAVATLQGVGEFSLSHVRKGEPFQKFVTKPGDLVIVRPGHIENRPPVYHAIGGSLSQNPRISVGFRQRK